METQGQMNINDFLGELLAQPLPKKPKTPKQATSKITAKTRRESHEITDKAPLHEKVLAVLDGKELTAHQIAEAMYKKGWLNYPMRSVIQPRITELVHEGKVEAVGDALDEKTQRKVAVYKVV